MPRKPEPPTLIKTQARLAAIFQADQKTISAWSRLDGFPKKEKAGWDVVAVSDWVRAHREGETGSLTDERRRLTKEQADREAIRNAQARGEMIEFATVERIWSESYAELFSLVDRGFHQLAPKLSGLDAIGILGELGSWWTGVREQLGEQWSAKAE